MGLSSGVDTFQYRVSDGEDESDLTTVSITVAAEDADELLHLQFDDGFSPATDSSSA